MGRRRGRNRESFLDTLMEAPWQLSMALGVIVFIVLKWVLPAIASDSLILKPISAAFSGMAWMFSGFFFVIGAVVFVMEAASRSKLSDQARSSVPRSDPISQWKTPSWAPRAPTRQQDVVVIDIGGGSTVPRGYQGGARSDTPDAHGAWREPTFGNAGKPTEWSIDLIRDIEWKRFEDVCQKFYETKGIKSATTPLGPDGGIDIRLYQDDSGQATSIVQCKAWGDRMVGVKPIRELLGVMTHEKIAKAFFMTSGRFSDDAKDVAKSNRITLIDGEMLLMMIKRLPDADQKSLLTFATAGDYATPTCPTCGIKMKLVPGKAGRPDFWGCHNYPRCRQMLGKRRAA